MRRSERLSTVSVMAAGLAHEINNPLAILGNRIEIMEREAKTHIDVDRIRKDLAVLGEHVERIRTLTTDLLAFAREEGDDSEALDLGALLERMVRLLERTVRTQGVDIELEIDEGIPTIPANVKAIETVFVNLIMNAGQATPSGGSITVTAAWRPDKDVVVGKVRDTGPGVPQDLRGRIFEPFFTTKAERGGTGLGLTVCRTVVERHGGTIGLDSSPNGGTCFVVELPVRKAT